jgi:prepilin-type N-terminal cleavage/methylation domain-containing protein
MEGNKLKAFTLTEVMVVLALTGMVVAIAFYVWYNFEAFGAGYREDTAQVNEWNALHQGLRLDASRSVRLEQKGSSIQFWADDSLPGPRWEVLPTHLVRTLGQQVDSFRVGGCEAQASYRNEVWVFQLMPKDSLLPDTLNYALPEMGVARVGEGEK